MIDHEKVHNLQFFPPLTKNINPHLIHDVTYIRNKVLDRNIITALHTMQIGWEYSSTYFQIDYSSVK